MFNESVFEINLFGISILFGVFVAFLFDWFRVARKVVRTGMVGTCVEDVAFWVVTAFCFFALCLKFNNGEIRLFMLGGAAAGGFLYFKTVSRFVIGFLVKLICLSRKFLSFLFNILLFPLKLLIRALNRPFFCVLSFGKNRFSNVKKNLKFRCNVLKKFSPLSAFCRRR